MKPTDAALLETSLSLIYNIKGRWKNIPLDEPSSEDEMKNFKSAMGIFEMMMWIHGSENKEAIIKDIIEDDKAGKTDGTIYIRAAESFAKAVKQKLGITVLQALIPVSSMNHKIRQGLRRKGCETLASACDNRITLD